MLRPDPRVAAPAVFSISGLLQSGTFSACAAASSSLLTLVGAEHGAAAHFASESEHCTRGQVAAPMQPHGVTVCQMSGLRDTALDISVVRSSADCVRVLA